MGILRGDVVADDVVVIRNEGPVGGPGVREMLSPTSAVGSGLIKEVALIMMDDSLVVAMGLMWDISHLKQLKEDLSAL